MAEMLLLNPSARRRTRKSRKAPSAAQRRARAAFASMARRRGRSPARRRVRRANPISTLKTRTRANPARRRRNPIAFGGLGGIGRAVMTSAQNAAIGAAGAVAVDVAYGQIAGMLPVTLRPVPGAVGAGNAIKAVATVVLGRLLSKITKGLSVKAAEGALTVQAHDMLMQLLPANLKAMTMQGVGYYSPAMITQGTNRVGPMRGGMNAYMKPGVTPLLNAYMRKGTSPLLSGSSNARAREGVSQFR